MHNNYNNLISIKFARAEQPIFKENKSKNIVEFGFDNDYPNYLLGLFNESPKHGAIVKSKVGYIFGHGFQDVPVKANSAGESWNQILKKCIMDDELYGGYYLQVIYNLLGQIKDVFHIEYHKVRSNKEQTEYYVKNDWQSFKEKARMYPSFNPAEPVASQILAVKQYNPLSDVYPLPSYYASLNYIDSDVQVSRHVLGNAKDGFVASTLINLNGGEPQEEHKAAIEKGIKKKFTGSEGDRVVIMFNKSKDNAADIVPLSTTMLTKEDFTNINNLIQQEIFAGHQIVSPALMGIKTEGQLGGRTELRDAYEIFNNTYVQERQETHNENFGELFAIIGIPGEYKIEPVEPLKFEFGEVIVSQNLTKDEIREIMGKQPLDTSVKTQAQIISDNINALSPLVANKVLESMTPEEIRSLAGLIPKTNVPTTPDGSMPLPIPTQQESQINSNLAGMTGRQFQQLERIKRKYEKGSLTREQAAMMLRNGFGLTDGDIALLLDPEPAQFASQVEIDMELLAAFEKFSEDSTDYEVLETKSASEVNYFAEQKDLNELESNIIFLIKKDKGKVDTEAIAKALDKSTKVIDTAITGLVKAEVLKINTQKIGTDKIPVYDVQERNLAEYKPEATELVIRYTYAWRDIVPVSERNTSTHPSRMFCVEMMKLASTRVWSRSNIEQMSSVLGYSVWDRVGGFWNRGTFTDTQCRHEWKSLIIRRKKQ